MARNSLLREFGAYLMENKKWWMVPIILVFALVGALLVFGNTSAGAFIYTLF